MPWSEFVLRCKGFREHRLFTMSMTREISYEVYRNGFVFSKSNPVHKNSYWPLDKNAKVKSKVTASQKAAFLAAYSEYKKQVDDRTGN